MSPPRKAPETSASLTKFRMEKDLPGKDGAKASTDQQKPAVDGAKVLDDISACLLDPEARQNGEQAA